MGTEERWKKQVNLTEAFPYIVVEKPEEWCQEILLLSM